MQERLRLKLSKCSRQSITSMLVNFISSIPQDEEIEIAFSMIDENGKSHIQLDAVKDTGAVEINRTVELADNHMVCNIAGSGARNPVKQATNAQKGG